MRYVQRDPGTGKIIAHFANEQSYATELLPDDHPDIVAFQEARWPKATPLEDRLAAIEARLTALERGRP